LFSVLLQRVGLVAPVVTPVMFDLVVDFTPGSSGTPENYDAALRTSLAVLAAGPGQVWVFLVDDDGATLAGTYQARVVHGHGRRSRAPHVQEQLAQGLTALGRRDVYASISLQAAGRAALVMKAAGPAAVTRNRCPAISPGQEEFDDE